MKTPGIIIIHKPCYDCPGLLKRQWAEGTDTLFFQALMPTLNLSIALRIVRGSSHMAHTTDADEFLKILSNELRAIVRDNPGSFIGVFLFGPLEDNFHIGLCHGLSDFPMNDATAVPIKDATQIIEGAPYIEVRDVNVPMLMSAGWPFETLSFAVLFRVPFPQQPGPGEYPVNA